MGVNWKRLYVDVEGCKDFGELEKLLMECKVEKGNVFGVIKKSIGNYGYNRDYRDRRNMSMGKMRDRIKELESKMGK
jgi:hypothetical protein